MRTLVIVATCFVFLVKAAMEATLPLALRIQTCLLDTSFVASTKAASSDSVKGGYEQIFISP
jgi:hypothetical protein